MNTKIKIDTIKTKRDDLELENQDYTKCIYYIDTDNIEFNTI